MSQIKTLQDAKRASLDAILQGVAAGVAGDLVRHQAQMCSLVEALVQWKKTANSGELEDFDRFSQENFIGFLASAKQFVAHRTREEGISLDPEYVTVQN